MITFFTLLLILTGNFIPGKETESSQILWAVEPNSSLQIAGRSSIDSFRCEVVEYLRKDTMRLQRDERGASLKFNRSALLLEVKKFNCHNGFITGDFRKTLKSDQFPYIRIQLISLEAAEIKPSMKKVLGQVDIVIAGVTKRMILEYQVKNLPGNRLALLGSKMMQFSDFNLTPPRRLAGFIRIEEDIKVNFCLYFKMIQT